MVHACTKQPRPRLEVADVFRVFGEAYRADHALPPDQARAFAAVVACRTETLGGHLDVCQECGFERPSYNSCLNRHCPKCQSIAATRWVEARKLTILPTAYFHVVFTLPAELRPLALHNRRVIFDLLFQAAAKTLLALGSDPRRLGGLLGLTAVLHTWTRDLSFHPHLHVIVTGGGLADDGHWASASAGYLFPIKVLGRLFRGTFLAGLKRLVDKGKLRHVDPETFPLMIDKLYRKEWRPYAKRPFAGPEQVYQYLGYYTHRTGIANHRLLDINDKSVIFKTRNEKTATLAGGEFIRRFLLHVLPRGFVKIRHYGLLAAKAESKRQAVRQVLEPDSRTASISETSPPAEPDAETDPIAPLTLRAITCPRCERPALARRPLPGRSPPRSARDGVPR